MLKEGDPVPEFELLDANGDMVRSTDLLGGPVVIYFYPHDDTPGCTAEACSFRDSYELFTDAGAKVVGISSDSPESHKRFAERHRLPFTLLSDEGGKVRKAFGVKGALLIPGRVTFVVDQTGIVRLVFNSQFRTQEHVDRSLEVIRSLNVK